MLVETHRGSNITFHAHTFVFPTHDIQIGLAWQSNLTQHVSVKRGVGYRNT